MINPFNKFGQFRLILILGIICLPNLFSCVANNSKTKIIPAPPKTGVESKISEGSVRNLLRIWEESQDKKDFSAYENCYGTEFIGVKRAGNKTVKFGYVDWLKDRRQMMSKADNLDVDIENLKIKLSGETAIVQFIQQYRSRQFSDFGEKTLHLKKIGDDLKIVFEELGFSTKVHD